jgi:hypothetical protein
MAEEAQLLPPELALTAFCNQLAPADDLQHLCYIQEMLFEHWQMDQTIVHLHQRAQAKQS